MLFLGSNIGNFDPPVARELLRAASARALRAGDALLLGSDLVKPERELLLAYDDPLQVTAAFNRNLLRRINDELGGTFDLDGFAHGRSGSRTNAASRCTWSAGAVSTCEIAAADMAITFEAGRERSGPRARTSTTSRRCGKKDAPPASRSPGSGWTRSPASR